MFVVRFDGAELIDFFKILYLYRPYRTGIESILNLVIFVPSRGG